MAMCRMHYKNTDCRYLKEKQCFVCLEGIAALSYKYTGSPVRFTYYKDNINHDSFISSPCFLSYSH